MGYRGKNCITRDTSGLGEASGAGGGGMGPRVCVLWPGTAGVGVVGEDGCGGAEERASWGCERAAARRRRVCTRAGGNWTRERTAALGEAGVWWFRSSRSLWRCAPQQRTSGRWGVPDQAPCRPGARPRTSTLALTTATGLWPRGAKPAAGRVGLLLAPARRGHGSVLN